MSPKIPFPDALSSRRLISTWNASKLFLCSAIGAGVLTTAAPAQTCDLYPIALSAQALSKVPPGSVLKVSSGTRRGDLGWLCWSGYPSERKLVASLTPPGNSSTYTNPANTADHQVSVGDWVKGKPDVSNTRSVRKALDVLKTMDILVPVWDRTRRSDGKTTYRVSGFARVRILSHQLRMQNRITFRFLGFTTCGEQNQNLPPTVDAGPNQIITLPSVATLAGTANDDGLPTGGTLSIVWSKVSGPGSVTFSANAAAATANFSAPGDYVLRLTADDGLASASDEVAVRANGAPVAQDQSINTDEDTPVGVVLLATDANGDALTYQVSTLPQHGTLSGASPNFTYLPVADFNGADTFTFRANDGLADSGLATVRIFVRPVNDAPRAAAQSIVTDEDAAVGVTLRATDVDGDTLTFTVATPPSHGALRGTAPALTYVPAADYFGPDQFTFTVNDGVTNSVAAAIAISIAPINDAPMGRSGDVTTEEDTPVSVTLQGTDAENSPLTFVIVTPPSHGSLGGSAPSLTYTPGTNFAGADSFDFQVSDGALDSAQTTFRINVNPVNDTPRLIVPGPLTIPEDAVLRFGTSRVIVTDVDAAGGMVELSLSVTNGALRLDPTTGLTFASGRNGSSGMVVHGSVDSLNAALLGLIYLSSTNFSGMDTLAVVVDDRGQTGLGGSLADSNSISIMVTPVNDAPFFVSTPVTNAEAIPFPSMPAQSRPYTHSYAYDVDAVDPESSPVSYSLLESPAGMNINGTSGLIQWLPNTNDIGTVTVTVRATDTEGVEGFQTFDILVPPILINTPPVVSAGPDRSFAEITQPITLNGVVLDDGVPAHQPLTITWIKLAGPGNVTFNGSASAVTTASFDTPGLYVLQLTAHDTMEASSDLVEIRAGMLCSIKPSSDTAAWWPANLTTADSIGGRDATLSGSAGFGAGLVGSAFAFDTAADFARASAHPSLDLASGRSGFTVEFWIKPDSLLTGGVLGWAGGVRAERLFNSGVLRFHLATSGITFVQTPPLWPNTNSLIWTHVALTYDRTLSQARIYVNGIWVATATVGTTLLTTASDFYLGQAPGSPGAFFGALDEVTLYRRPLNAQEVYDVFASGSAGKCPIDSNAPPFVYAGADLFVVGVPGTATLNGEADDDDLPVDSTLGIQWSVYDGPGTVDFASPTSLVTAATFGTNGIYVLQLTVDDGQIQRRDLVEVRVETLCTIEPQGLAAWWPANGSAEDVLNGHDAILGNGAGYSSGKVAAAFRLDGNDYVLIPAQTNYDVGTSTSGFTLEFWIKPDSLLAGGVLGWVGGVRAERLFNGSTLRFHLATSGTTFVQASLWPNAASLTWMHVVLTYDRASSQVRIYANGVLVATAAVGTSLLTTATDFYLGQASGSPVFFPGQLDEISLYRRPLDAQEVYETFISGSAGKCPNDDNNPPVVDAGPNASIASFSETLQLQGQVADDGLPAGSTLRTRWSLFEGPGTVSFSDPHSPVSTVTFSANGLYLLQLEADDNAILRSDLLEVRVGIPCSVTDPAGLVAAWPGNGTAQDVVGGQFGILGNGAGFSSGKVGTAFRLDGNDNVLIPAQTSYDVGTGSSGFTLEFWIKPDSQLAGGVMGWSGGVRAERLFSGSTLRFHLAANGTTFVQASLWPTAASLTWTHVALTYDRASSQARVYANGVLVATATVGTSLLTTATDFYLGQASGSTVFFPGQFDEIALYSRPLPQAEIQAIFNTGSSGKCITTPNESPIVFAGTTNPDYSTPAEVSTDASDSGIATHPMNITTSVNGNQLTVSWPASYTGWRLQSQTNAPGVGLMANWGDVAGSASTNQVTIPIDPTIGSVFFRMVYP